MNQPPHPVPGNTAGLAAPREGAVPEPAHLKPKQMERRCVHGHPVIPNVPTDHRAQPRAHLRRFLAEISENIKDFGKKKELAEREGFEPSVEFPLHTLSKRAPSTTRTSLRSNGINSLP